VVAHAQQQLIAVGLQAHDHLGRRRRQPAVTQGVVDQVAHQQAPACRVDAAHPQLIVELQLDPWRGFARTNPAAVQHIGHGLTHQRGQVGGLGLKCAVAGSQAFALEQIVDQLAHLAQVAQQRIAGAAFVDQFGVQARACQR